MEILTEKSFFCISIITLIESQEKQQKKYSSGKKFHNI